MTLVEKLMYLVKIFKVGLFLGHFIFIFRVYMDALVYQPFCEW